VEEWLPLSILLSSAFKDITNERDLTLIFRALQDMHPEIDFLYDRLKGFSPPTSMTADPMGN
jgi:hypothetical protein